MSKIISYTKKKLKKLFGKKDGESKAEAEIEVQIEIKEIPIAYKILQVARMRKSLNLWKERAMAKVAKTAVVGKPVTGELNFLQVIRLKNTIRLKAQKTREAILAVEQEAELEALEEKKAAKRRQSVQGGAVRSVFSVIKFRKNVGVIKNALNFSKLMTIKEKINTFGNKSKVADLAMTDLTKETKVEEKVAEAKDVEKKPKPETVGTENKVEIKNLLEKVEQGIEKVVQGTDTKPKLDDKILVDVKDQDKSQESQEIVEETPEIRLAKLNESLEKSKIELKKIRKIQNSSTRNIEDVKPIYLVALEKAVLEEKAIKWMRTMRYHPPQSLQLLMEGICILKGIEPKITYDRIFQKIIEVDYWEPSQKLLGGNLIKELNDLKKPGYLIPENLNEFRDYILGNPNFDRTKMDKAFPPSSLLYDWMIKIYELGLITNVLMEAEDKMEEALLQEVKVKEKITSIKKDIKSLQKGIKLNVIAEEENEAKEKLKEIGENISLIVDAQS